MKDMGREEKTHSFMRNVGSGIFGPCPLQETTSQDVSVDAELILTNLFLNLSFRSTNFM